MDRIGRIRERESSLSVMLALLNLANPVNPVYSFSVCSGKERTTGSYVWNIQPFAGSNTYCSRSNLIKRVLFCVLFHQD